MNVERISGGRLTVATVMLAWLVISYSLFLFLPKALVIELMKEDGLFEMTGALCFLLAAIIAIMLFFKLKSVNDFHCLRTSRNIFFLILGLLFLFAFGEEISWGQRIFGFPTPEVLQTVNMQRELNVHNLVIFRTISANKLFSFFWFGYCVLLPVANAISKHSARVISRIAMPVVPLYVGLLFLANYGVSRIALIYVSADIHNSLIEFKEFNFGMLFLTVTIGFAYIYQGTGK